MCNLGLRSAPEDADGHLAKSRVGRTGRPSVPTAWPGVTSETSLQPLPKQAGLEQVTIF
jgi:hypothetical protein